MPSASKEENVLRLILEHSPLKEWHFKEIAQEANVTRAVASKWLHKYVAEGLLRRMKPAGQFPIYTVGSGNPVYRSLKRVYALEQLHRSGLLPALLSVSTAKTIVIFGSIARGDWYKDSDIDLFIFGTIPDFDRNLYERRLRRRIELHTFESRRDIQEVRTGLIRNVISGYVVKGSIQDII